MSEISGGNNLIDTKLIIEKTGINDDMRTADLGCGATGHFVFPVAEAIGKNGVIYAVDILKNNLKNIEHRAQQENMPQVKTVWSNLEIFKATQIETASLDIGMLINILFQSDKRSEIIREAIRLIKKEGKLLIIDWNKVATPFGPSAEERVNKENLQTVCERLGLELQEEFGAGQYHFGLVFLKH